jgi:hypothetical protein
MARSRRGDVRLPKGVSEIERPRGGRRYRAAIRNKGVEVHLGLYETPAFAAFAFNVASAAIGRGAAPPNEAPRSGGLSADEVRSITSQVRRRLGLDRGESASASERPSVEALLTFFEITVVGFWRAEVAADHTADSLDAAANRIVDAADLLFWERARGSPDPRHATADLLARRLDFTFRRPELTREVLDDDGDDPWRVARWLAVPETSAVGRGFREEIRYLYPDFFDEEIEIPSTWPEVLGVAPPLNFKKARDAYRRRSKTLHPDTGGTSSEFIRLHAAYEQAVSYFRNRGEAE